MTVGMYTGSFDPLHLGHLGVIEYAAPLFDELIVAVLANPHKPSALFGAAERVRLIEAATAPLSNVRCVTFDGLTVDLARRETADVLVRALVKELSTERVMAAMNECVSGVPTVFVPASPVTQDISSTRVRALLASGDLAAARALVPATVGSALERVAPLDS